MKILIDSLFLSSGLQHSTFLKSVQATGTEVIVSKYRRNLVEFESDIPNDEGIIVYGSIQFVEDALKKVPRAMAFYSQHTYNCSFFMSVLPLSLFVNQMPEFYPAAVFQQQHAANAHYGRWRTDSRKQAFIRSDSGRKLFAGKVLPADKFTTFDLEGLAKHSMIMVADVKCILHETRYFIYGSTIVSSSMTHINGVPTTGQLDKSMYDCVESRKFMYQVAEMVDQLQCIDTVYVCDVAAYTLLGSSCKKIGIMEFNAASTSDMHLCNVTDIFNAKIDCIEKENSCD
jgi:hypothetical protein